MQLKHWPTHLLRHAVVCLGLAANLYVTAWEPTTEPSEAAPARAWRPADISALLPQVGWPILHVRQHQREVCQLSPWDEIARPRLPYPPDYRAAFAYSLLLYPPPLRLALRLAFPRGEATGLPRSADVPVWVRPHLSARGAPSAPGGVGAPGPGPLPFRPS